MSFKVNRRQCSTCIFGPKSPIPPERLEDYKREWAEKGATQECHHATMTHEEVACRGHYEAARRGELPYPIQDIAEGMGLNQLRMDQMMGLSEAMGWVEFVEVDETPTFKLSIRKGKA